jgi:hypothetical protein
VLYDGTGATELVVQHASSQAVEVRPDTLGCLESGLYVNRAAGLKRTRCDRSTEYADRTKSRSKSGRADEIEQRRKSGRADEREQRRKSGRADEREQRRKSGRADEREQRRKSGRADEYGRDNVRYCHNEAGEILANLHICSGAVITSNSRRLSRLLPELEAGDKREFEASVASVADDIDQFAHLSIEDCARVVARFEACAARATDMKVCGACGLRDPEASYTHSPPLGELEDEHWLRIDIDAAEWLHGQPHKVLYGHTDGTEVEVALQDVLTITYLNDCLFHVVPEALDHGGRVWVCDCCQRSWNTLRGRGEPLFPDDSTLPAFYWTGAPSNSIARGRDYGRLSGLRAKGIPVDVSTLEKLVLAKARCHYVAVKVQAQKRSRLSEVGRSRLLGASTVFPHSPVLPIVVVQTLTCTVRAEHGDAVWEGLTASIAAAARVAVSDVSVTSRQVNNRFGNVRTFSVTAVITPWAPADADQIMGNLERDAASLDAGGDVTIDNTSAPFVDKVKCFGEAAIKSALGAMRICFVGPKSQRTRLEESALDIEDLRLRPHVLHNYLQLAAWLHGDNEPPSKDDIRRWVHEHTAHASGLVGGVQASWLDPDDVESIPEPSDVADVRAVAQSCEHMSLADDFEPASNSDGAQCAIHMQHVGVLDFHNQEMAAVVNSIESAMKRRLDIDGGNSDCEGGDDANIDNTGDGGGGAEKSSSNDVSGGGDGDGRGDNTVGSGSNRTDQGNHASLGRLEMQRADTPVDDYENASEALYAAWWPLFILRRGLVKGKSLTPAKLRHLFLYYDNRFAHDMALLFYLANVTMRHAVNRSVTMKVKSSDTAFGEFQALINDDEFHALLKAAKCDPSGPEAQQVLKRVIRFINLSASLVPWGAQERAAEMTSLIATHRAHGPASIFYSIAPDDVHNPLSIRYSYAFVGVDTFPGNAPAFACTLCDKSCPFTSSTAAACRLHARETHPTRYKKRIAKYGRVDRAYSAPSKFIAALQGQNHEQRVSFDKKMDETSLQVNASPAECATV